VFHYEKSREQDYFKPAWIPCATFAHNHPSGVAEPSHADEILTRALKGALALVDIQVLDHFIVAGPRTMSFAERGLL
jgi:DNA repair protein RadC